MIKIQEKLYFAFDFIFSNKNSVEYFSISSNLKGPGHFKVTLHAQILEFFL